MAISNLIVVVFISILTLQLKIIELFDKWSENVHVSTYSPFEYFNLKQYEFGPILFNLKHEIDSFTTFLAFSLGFVLKAAFQFKWPEKWASFIKFA